MADTSSHFTSADLVRLVIGTAGAFVSLKFLKDMSTSEKLLLVLGGAILSYVGTQPVASYLKVDSAEGLVGFMLGLFGMAIMTKVYEAINLLDTKRFVEWFEDKFLTKKKD